jgi:cysteinyl-tRNA synthetase
MQLYNTLTRRKERFEPLEPGRVGIYSCGPTVYSHQHLGNMRPYLFADLLKRTFLWNDLGVRHVVVAARREGVSVWEIAEKWTRLFKEDLQKLNVLEPDVWCKATDHIEEQIAMVKTLEEKGFTYRTSDGIYFDTAKDPHYGELARLDVQAQRMDERIERGHEKRSPADFALWKFSPTEGPRRKMEWESPWGVGFPGWHIECSAMSSKYLGVPFDIHTGGVDHIPVHHPNEIAQSENAFDVRPWVRYWLHEEWLLFGGEKMAKSKGEVLTVTDLEARGIEPLAYRLFFLSAHYRQQQTFSESAIEGAQSAYQRLVRHAVELREAADRTGSEAVAEYRERFRQVLDDDLNAPQGLAVLWEVIRSGEIGGAEKWDLVCEWDRVLGLGLEEAHLEEIELDERVEALVREREEARRTRNFARADEIREELTRQGILLEDTKEGTRWRRA